MILIAPPPPSAQQKQATANAAALTALSTDLFSTNSTVVALAALAASLAGHATLTDSQVLNVSQTVADVQAMSNRVVSNISSLSALLNTQYTSLQAQTASNLTTLATSFNTQYTSLQAQASANITAARNLACAAASDFMTLPQTQAIPTLGARGVKYFEINGSSYLAIANYNDGTTTLVASQVLRADPVTQQFQVFQSIMTNGGAGVEAFTIGATSFLIFACMQSGSVYNLNVPLYRFSPTSNQFVVHQNIATNGAASFGYFTIGNSSFLALANHYDDTTGYNTQSRVLIYNPSTQMFESFQSFSTAGAHGVDILAYKGETYLAFAFYYSGTTYSLNSPVYKFNATLNQFVLFQTIPTIGVTSVDLFSMPSGELFLGYAKHYTGSVYASDTPVYRYDNATGHFVLFQTLIAFAARGLKSFVTDGVGYYAVTSHYDTTTASYSLNSKVYKYDPNQHLFVIVHDVPTIGGTFMDFFVMNGVGYLACTNYYNGSYRLNSFVYRFLTCSP